MPNRRMQMIRKDLVQEAADGCPRSREAIFAHLVPLFLRQARAACNRFDVPADNDLLRDLAHEVVICLLTDNARVMRKWLANDLAEFEHFASAVATKKLHAMAKALARTRKRELELLVDILEIEEEYSCPEDSVLHDAVRSCLDMLTDEEKQMLNLRYCEGRSSGSIAKMTDKTCSQVYQLTHRARCRLKELVAKELTGSTALADW